MRTPATALCSAPAALRISNSAATAALQALLPTSAVRASVSALAIIAEGALAGAWGRLLPVAPLRLALILIEIAGAGLVLVHSPAVLLVEIGLTAAGPVLLIEVRLIAPALLRQVPLALISKLRLIVFLIEMRCAAVEIVGPVIVDVVPVQVVAVNVVRIQIVAVEIVGVDVIPVKVIHVYIAIREGIGVGNVGVVVIDHSGVVPAASP